MTDKQESSTDWGEVATLTMDEKIVLLLQKIDSLAATVGDNSVKLTSITQKVVPELAKVKRENDMLKQSLNTLCMRYDKQELRIASLESEEYRCRLTIMNAPEKQKENPKDTVSEILTQLGVYHDANTVIFAYRAGKYTKTKCRPIKIKFHNPVVRQSVWDKRVLLTVPMRLKQDFPEHIATKRKVLQEIVNLARNSPKYNDKAFLRQDQMLINGKQYNLESLCDLPDDLQKVPGGVQNNNVVYFYGVQHPFSNFFPSKVTFRGIEFSCVEQAYQYMKASHYDRHDKAAEIMAESNPVQHKKVGQSFGRRDWEDPTVSLKIMSQIVLQKFSQNSYLKSVLLSTCDHGERDLAEANPYDKYWGTGCSAHEAVLKFK